MCCQCHHTYILYSKRCLAIHLRHKVVPGLHHVEQQGHELELRTHHVDIRNFFYEPFRGQGELLIIETFRPVVLTLGILTVGQAYQEECEIYKASIVLGKLGKGYIIRGILLGGDIRNSRLGIIRWNRKYYRIFFYLYICAHVEVGTYVFNTFYCLLFYSYL